MTTKIDLRIKKSTYAIKTAFWKLLFQQSFQKITIKNILLEAQVNRATFYKYFADKYDLLDSVEQDLLTEFEHLTQQISTPLLHNDTDVSELNVYYQQSVQYIYTNSTKFSALLKPSGDPAFIKKLIATDQKIWQQKNLVPKSSIPEHYATAAMIGMATSLITEWVNSDFHESPQEFSVIMRKIVTPLLSEQSFFKKN